MSPNGFDGPQPCPVQARQSLAYLPYLVRLIDPRSYPDGKDLRLIVVRTRNCEDSMSRRVCVEWIDRIMNELMIAYRAT
ncbi:hypothetical protein F2Q70_00029610 [Brassica cretica]|uniref:Uncharacterized protein n=1 Tax=Brassica cretica TaxID=69181 RepID=A0A8S9FIA1_BRACR|nr:hypothetical protein F2Q70_00029610 [Brassica cretica]